MKPAVVGIIAEYNPFHQGHAYQIQKAKELTGAKYCIVAMSGDFVQRGTPAVFDKHTRAHMALLAGADLVLELPPYFAVSSAEDFAACGVSALDHLGVVSHLCFGSECGDINILNELAKLLILEPESFTEQLKAYLKQGFTYPQAREKALLETSAAELPADILSSPNNILGIEYCKAILRRSSSMIPVTITRKGDGYHDATFGSEFASATAIRRYLQEQTASDETLLRQIPEELHALFTSSKPLFADDFSTLLSYRLLELAHLGSPYEDFLDINTDLADRILNKQLDFASFDDRILQLKTRQVTYTRISRCLMHILLHMTEKEALSRKQRDYLSYIRILGFRRDSAELLSEIKKCCDLPMITKTADAAKRLDEDALNEFRQDLFCSHVYQSVYAQKYHETVRNEFTQPIVIL